MYIYILGKMYNNFWVTGTTKKYDNFSLWTLNSRGIWQYCLYTIYTITYIHLQNYIYNVYN